MLTRREIIGAIGLATVPYAVGFGTPAIGGELRLDETRWVDDQSVGSFVCRAEFPLREIQGVLVDLGNLQQEIEHQLGVHAGAHRVEMFLFQSRGSYSQYVSRRVPGGGKRRALYLQQGATAQIFVYRHNELETDIRHEATHAILNHAVKGVPLWLDEGLAEYFEVPRGLRQRGNPHLKRLRWAIRLGWKADLRRLEAIETVAEMGGNEYRDSWGWTHFLLHGPHFAQVAFADHLKERQAGRISRPLSQTLMTVVPALGETFVKHILSIA